MHNRRGQPPRPIGRQLSAGRRDLLADFSCRPYRVYIIYGRPSPNATTIASHMLYYIILYYTTPWDIKKTFDARLVSCDSAFYRLRSALNNASSLHPLTRSVHNSEHVCLLKADSNAFRYRVGRHNNRHLLTYLLTFRNVVRQQISTSTSLHIGSDI